jgi:hypothetical protein
MDVIQDLGCFLGQAGYAVMKGWVGYRDRDEQETRQFGLDRRGS